MLIYDIADLRVGIQNEHPYTTRFCEKYLSPDQDSPMDVLASVTQEDLEIERQQSPGFSAGYIENICLYRSMCMQMPAHDRMLLHAATLEYDSGAYAFLGRSGTGKSTHTGLWLKHVAGSKILNGDKPILKIDDSGVMVYGTPWMGKEGRGYNAKAPLKGLCFLEQAKVNEIRRLSPAEAATRLFLQILLPSEEEAAGKTLELADKLITNVPAWLLSCDISEQAVEKSFEALTEKNYSKTISEKIDL